MNANSQNVLELSVTRHARVAGMLYVGLFILGPFVFLFGKATALVPGDPAASAANVVAMGAQFRVGILIEAAIVLIEIVLAALLYVIFRPVHHAISLAAAFARLGEAVVQAVNTLTSGLVLLVVGGAGTLTAFTAAQKDAIIHLFLGANAFLILVWGILFGLHLLLLGYLVRASTFLPRWLGVLLVIAGFGYLAQSVGTIMWPSAKSLLDGLVVLLAVPGELALVFWLLVKGINVPAWRARASA